MNVNKHERTEKGAEITLTSNKNLCLNLDHNRMHNGAAINLWTCNGHAAQKWVSSGGQVKLTSNPSFCLNLDHNRKHNGAAINLWTCNGHAAQKWQAATYVLGETDKNACPAHYENIIDKKQCQEAGSKFGAKSCTEYQGGHHGSNGAIGCSVNTNNNCLHFNVDNLTPKGNIPKASRYACVVA